MPLIKYCMQRLVYKISDSGEFVFLVMAVIRFHAHSCFSVGYCSIVAVAHGTLNSDPFFHKNLRPAGPILSKKRSAGPKFSPDQNFRDKFTILPEIIHTTYIV